MVIFLAQRVSAVHSDTTLSFALHMTRKDPCPLYSRSKAKSNSATIAQYFLKKKQIFENELDPVIKQDLDKQDPASLQNSEGSQDLQEGADLWRTAVLIGLVLLSLLERKDGPFPQIRGTPSVKAFHIRMSTDRPHSRAGRLAIACGFEIKEIPKRWPATT